MNFNHDQLHTAVSLFLAGRIMEGNEKNLWKPLMPSINNNKVPKDPNHLGRILMIKNVGIGAIIIYSYAIENLLKTFNPQIKKRHIGIIDPPHDLGLNELEAIMFIKTIFPLLKDGFLRYNEPRQEENFISSEQARQIFIKIFKYYIKKLKIDLENVKCFKVEFFHYKYPFIDELI
jgi:hypothetical protein